jgi:3-(3-hydroxy-phenyl)propionate hydroxylase
VSDTIYDVAIVGYGPSGAVLAALLGQAGLSVHVCDRLPGVYEIPRAIALDHEIMRVFQQLGLVEQIAPYFEPFTNSEFYGVDGQLIRRMTMIAPPYPQGYTPSMVFSQPPVERALRARVAQLPTVTVALETEMRAMTQTADEVSLRLKNAQGETEHIRARWVVACDGGASSLRAQAGITLEDLDFDEPWLVVDVLVNEQGLRKLPQVSVQYCEPERPCTLVIGPKNHRRWEISLKSGEDPAEAATPEGTWRLLSRWLTPEDGQLWRQASYRFHALVADRWRVGRVLVAGDAAHMQPPFLGQGMCQGVRDVANLAWKLIAVQQGQVQGAAAERLLDSYGAERKAHVRELTQRIKHIGSVICERDVDRARARDAKLLQDCGGVVKDTPRQDVLPQLETGLLTQHAHSARGALFPQPRLGASNQLMDEVLGHGWRWVSDAQLAPPTDGAGLTNLQLTENLREAEGVLATWFARHQCHGALVRPDHYVYGVANTTTERDALLQEWQQALH